MEKYSRQQYAPNQSIARSAEKSIPEAVMTNAYSLIFGGLGILGIFNGLQGLVRQLEPHFSVTYYPLEFTDVTLKALFFLLFGIIATTIVINYEIQTREMQRQD